LQGMSSERVKAAFEGLANLCSDPEKPALLEPLRREICAEYVKRKLGIDALLLP